MNRLRIESDLGKQSIALVILGLVSSVLALSVGAMVLAEAEYVARFGALPFVALGALFAVIGAVAIFSGKSSSAVLVLDDAPRLGGALRGTIETRLPVTDGARATVTLYCAVFEGVKQTRRFSETQTIEPAEIERAGRTVRIPIRLALPSRAPVDDGSGAVEWRLECRLPPEIEVAFPVRLASR